MPSSIKEYMPSADFFSEDCILLPEDSSSVSATLLDKAYRKARDKYAPPTKRQTIREDTTCKMCTSRQIE